MPFFLKNCLPVRKKKNKKKSIEKDASHSDDKIGLSYGTSDSTIHEHKSNEKQNTTLRDDIKTNNSSRNISLKNAKLCDDIKTNHSTRNNTETKIDDLNWETVAAIKQKADESFKKKIVKSIQRQSNHPVEVLNNNPRDDLTSGDVGALECNYSSETTERCDPVCPSHSELSNKSLAFVTCMEPNVKKGSTTLTEMCPLQDKVSGDFTLGKRIEGDKITQSAIDEKIAKIEEKINKIRKVQWEKYKKNLNMMEEVGTKTEQIKDAEICGMIYKEETSDVTNLNFEGNRNLLDSSMNEVMRNNFKNDGIEYCFKEANVINLLTAERFSQSHCTDREESIESFSGGYQVENLTEKKIEPSEWKNTAEKADICQFTPFYVEVVENEGDTARSNFVEFLSSQSVLNELDVEGNGASITAEFSKNTEETSENLSLQNCTSDNPSIEKSNLLDKNFPIKNTEETRYSFVDEDCHYDERKLSDSLNFNEDSENNCDGLKKEAKDEDLIENNRISDINFQTNKLTYKWDVYEYEFDGEGQLRNRKHHTVDKIKQSNIKKSINRSFLALDLDDKPNNSLSTNLVGEEDYASGDNSKRETVNESRVQIKDKSTQTGVGGTISNVTDNIEEPLTGANIGIILESEKEDLYLKEISTHVIEKINVNDAENNSKESKQLYSSGKSNKVNEHIDQKVEDETGVIDDFENVVRIEEYTTDIHMGIFPESEKKDFYLEELSSQIIREINRNDTEKNSKESKVSSSTGKSKKIYIDIDQKIKDETGITTDLEDAISMEEFTDVKKSRNSLLCNRFQEHSAPFTEDCDDRDHKCAFVKEEYDMNITLNSHYDGKSSSFESQGEEYSLLKEFSSDTTNSSAIQADSNVRESSSATLLSCSSIHNFITDDIASEDATHMDCRHDYLQLNEKNRLIQTSSNKNCDKDIKTKSSPTNSSSFGSIVEKKKILKENPEESLNQNHNEKNYIDEFKYQFLEIPNESINISTDDVIDENLNSKNENPISPTFDLKSLKRYSQDSLILESSSPCLLLEKEDGKSEEKRIKNAVLFERGDIQGKETRTKNCGSYEERQETQPSLINTHPEQQKKPPITINILPKQSRISKMIILTKCRKERRCSSAKTTTLCHQNKHDPNVSLNFQRRIPKNSFDETKIRRRDVLDAFNKKKKEALSDMKLTARKVRNVPSGSYGASSNLMRSSGIKTSTIIRHGERKRSEVPTSPFQRSEKRKIVNDGRNLHQPFDEVKEEDHFNETLFTISSQDPERATSTRERLSDASGEIHDPSRNFLGEIPENPIDDIEIRRREDRNMFNKMKREALADMKSTARKVRITRYRGVKADLEQSANMKVSPKEKSEKERRTENISGIPTSPFQHPGKNKIENHLPGAIIKDDAGGSAHDTSYQASERMTPGRRRVLDDSRKILSLKYPTKMNGKAYIVNTRCDDKNPYHLKPPELQRAAFPSSGKKNMRLKSYTERNKLNPVKKGEFKTRSPENTELSSRTLSEHRNKSEGRKTNPDYLKMKFDSTFERYARKGSLNCNLISYKRSNEWLADAGIVGKILTADKANDAFKYYSGLKLTLKKEEYRHYVRKIARLTGMDYDELNEKLCSVVAKNNCAAKEIMECSCH